MKNIKSLSVIFFSSIVISCTGQNNKARPAPECISLNESGYSLLKKYLLTRDTILAAKRLDSAKNFFKRAVNCDSNYAVAYYNLKQASFYTRDYKTEMLALNKLIILTHHSVLFIIDKAQLFQNEKMADSAKITFAEADSICDLKLLKNQENLKYLALKVRIVETKDGKEVALKKLHDLIKKYPADSTALINRTLYLFHPKPEVSDKFISF